MKMTFYRFIALALLVAMLASCTPASPTAAPQPQEGNQPAATQSPAQPAAGTPKSGGVLRMTQDQDPITSLDPIVPFNNSSIWTILNIYDQFYRVGKDGKSIEPDAAEKYEMSPDGLTYTIYIRTGLTFADGSPVTIDDVVFSSERMLKGESWGFLFPSGTTVKAGDKPNTVVFTLEKPNAPFINNLAGFWSSIVPKKLVEAQGDKFWEKPIGSGPFMVKEWTQGGDITLVKNPSYWQKPYPYLDEVDLKFVPEDNARMAQFQAGELDVALYVPYGQIDTIKAIQGVSVDMAPAFAVSLLDLNTAAKPLDDIRVRQALALAMDKQAIVDAVLLGNGTPANILWPQVLYWDPNIGSFNKPDLEKAKALIKEAGLSDGFDLTISYIAGDTSREQIGTILIDQFSKIGVRGKLEALDSTTYNDRQSKGGTQLGLNGWTSDVIDPSELNFIMGCDYAKPRNGACNEEYDKLIVTADQEMDPAKREQLYHQLFGVATDWLINIPIYYNPTRTATWNYVKDFKVLPTANFRLWEVWLDK